MLDKWNEDLRKEFGNKDFKFIGNDSLNNIASEIPMYDHFSAVLNELVPDWRQRNVVVTNNRSIKGSYGYSYFRSKTGSELEVVHSKNIKNYLQYLIISQLAKQKENPLISISEIQKAIDDYKKDKNDFLQDLFIKSDITEEDTEKYEEIKKKKVANRTDEEISFFEDYQTRRKAKSKSGKELEAELSRQVSELDNFIKLISNESGELDIDKLLRYYFFNSEKINMIKYLIPDIHNIIQDALIERGIYSDKEISPEVINFSRLIKGGILKINDFQDFVKDLNTRKELQIETIQDLLTYINNESGQYYYELVWQDDKRFLLRSSGKYKYGTKIHKKTISNFAKVKPLNSRYYGQSTIPEFIHRDYTVVGFPRNDGYTYYFSDKSMQTSEEFLGSNHGRLKDYVINMIDEKFNNHDLEISPNSDKITLKKFDPEKKTLIFDSLYGSFSVGDQIKVLDINLSDVNPSENAIQQMKNLLQMDGLKVKVKDFSKLLSKKFWQDIQSILPEQYTTIFDSLEKISTFNYYLASLFDQGLSEDNVLGFKEQILEIANQIANAEYIILQSEGQTTIQDSFRISIKQKTSTGKERSRSLTIRIPDYDGQEPESVTQDGQNVIFHFKTKDGVKQVIFKLSELKFYNSDINTESEITSVSYNGKGAEKSIIRFKKVELEEEVSRKTPIHIAPLMVTLKQHLEKHFGLKINLYTTAEIKADPVLNKIEGLTRKNAFIYKGEICINLNKAKPSDFLHEFMHLILGQIRVVNPTLYRNIISKSVSQGDIYTRQMTDPRAVEDIQEELFVEKFSKYISSYIPAVSSDDENVLLQLKALLPNAINKTFMLKANSVTGLEDVAKMSLEDLFNTFGSYMLTETDEEVKNFIHGESAQTQRKISNIIAELKNRGFIVQEFLEDGSVIYHEREREILQEKQEKEGKKKPAKYGFNKDSKYIASYSEEELREKVAKHIVAVEQFIKEKSKGTPPALIQSAVKQDISDFNKLERFSDVVYSDDEAESLQQEVVAKLTPFIDHSVSTSKAAIDKMENAYVEEVTINSRYISLYSYLNEVGENGNSFVTPFNLEELIAERTKQYTEEGKEPPEIKMLIDSEVAGFVQSAKIGYDVHKAANMFFKWFSKGNLTRQQFYSILSSGYSDETGTYNFETFHANSDCINSLYDSLMAIRKELFRMFPDCEIIPNIQLITDINDSSKQLVANLDLIIVEKSGKVNIFKFKASGHLYGQLGAKILERDDYHLGFIRQMLAKKGIPAEQMGLYTIGLNVAKDPDGNPYRISFEKIDNRLAEKNVHGEYNRLTWKSGDFSRKIDRKIEVGLASAEITVPFKDDVIQFMNVSFPTLTTYIQESDREIDDYIKHKKVYPSDDPNYKWMIIDYTQERRSPDRKIYIKSDEKQEVNTELRQKIKEQLERERKSKKAMTDLFVSDLQKVFNGELSISELLSNNPLAQERMTVIFSKYLTGDWQFVKDDALADFGIYLLQNKEEGIVDIINFTSLGGDLNEQLDFGLGRSIAGHFLKRFQENEYDKMLRASKGNAELMKVMFILSQPQVAAKFNGNIKIGQIRVLNHTTCISTIADNATIGNSFNVLSQQLAKAGIKIGSGLSKIEFVNPFELFKNHVYGLMNIDGLGLHVDSLFGAMERMSPTTLYEMEQELLKIEELMRTNKSWKALLSDTPYNLAKSTDPIVQLYVLLWKCIWQCRGDFRQVEKLSKYSGTWKDKTLFNGTRVNMPGTEEDVNQQKATILARNAMDRITKRLTEWYHPYRNKVVQKLWEGAGYTSTQNAILGNQNHLYANMFVRNPDGSLNELMLLKDPSDPSLKQYEREFLEDFLWQVNSVRFKLSSKTDPAIAELKADKSWYWLPLVEADTSSKLQQGVIQRLTKSVKQLSQKLKQFKQTGMDDTLYSEESWNTLKAGIMNYEMFNQFTVSERSIETRKNLLDTADDTSIWEQNLETVLTKYMFASIRKQEFDRMLPLIKGLRILGQSYFLNTGHSDPDYLKDQMNEFDSFLKDYIESAVYNKSILNDETKYLAKFASQVKFYASTLALGFNFVGGIRECLEGAWKTVGRVQSQWYSPEKRFTKTDWFKAIGIIITDAPDFMQRVTLLEAICQRYRIANIDMNALADRIKTNKAGIFNARDRMIFWFQTSPDYFTRMGMLLAQMIHEGVFEALGYDQNGLTYDWKKDKRFSDYAKGSGPKYDEQRAEFLSRIEQYNAAHFTKLTEKDGLPEPYTQDEMRALKQFSDMTFGAYDHDTKMLVEKMFLGSLFFQFKTYLSATKTAYFLKPGRYNQGKREQVRDDKGNLLYWHTTEDGKNYVSSEPSKQPYTWNTDSFMEGIVWSLEDAFKEFNENGVTGFRTRLQEDRVLKSNLIQFSYNMFTWLMLGALITYLIKLWANKRKEDSVGEGFSIAKMASDEAFNVFQKAVIGSFTDFNILNSFVGNISDAEPASIAILNTFFNSTGETLFGDKSLKYWLKTNSGLYRSLQGVGDNLYQLYKESQD